MGFIDNSAHVRAELDRKIEIAMEAVAITAEGYAKLKSPVDTGRLRGSISHRAIKNTAYIGTNVPYAVYQEFGTIHIKPKEFLKSAVFKHHNVYKRIVEQYLK